MWEVLGGWWGGSKSACQHIVTSSTREGEGAAFFLNNGSQIGDKYRLNLLKTKQLFWFHPFLSDFGLRWSATFGRLQSQQRRIFLVERKISSGESQKQFLFFSLPPKELLRQQDLHRISQFFRWIGSWKGVSFVFEQSLNFFWGGRGVDKVERGGTVRESCTGLI